MIDIRYYNCFSVWLRTGTNQADINRFRIYTGKYFTFQGQQHRLLSIKNWLSTANLCKSLLFCFGCCGPRCFVSHSERACATHLFITKGRFIKSGIVRDKTMTDKLMHIPNKGTQNYLVCRLQLVVETFRHLT